jgi:hypothetical protein
LEEKGAAEARIKLGFSASSEESREILSSITCEAEIIHSQITQTNPFESALTSSVRNLHASELRNLNIEITPNNGPARES